MSDILWLYEIGDADRERVGGKAYALARLRRAGLPVPDGFVLTAGNEGLSGPAREAFQAAHRRLAAPVAVRSSAAAEDTAEASFAGQYRTLLDVRGLGAALEAVAACLASARDATPYAGALGLAGDPRMAVLVQTFVEPRVAGVAFTRHPFRGECLLIEASPGRGDALVSGRVRPERYVVARSGTVLEAPADGSLSARELAALAGLALKAEALLGGPQDVEWALGGEGPVLLQSRPITVEAEAPHDPSVRRLTRANVGEILPQAVTPLTWTTVGAFLEHAFREVARRAGLVSGDPPPFLVLHRGRLYLNLSLSMDVAARLPGVSAADAERLVLGSASASTAARLELRDAGTIVVVGARLARIASRLPADIERAAAAVERLPSAAAVAATDPPGLRHLLDAFTGTGRTLATTHVAASGASAFRLALLGRILAGIAPDGALDRLSRLVAGLEDVESTEPTLALEALAMAAAAEPETRAWLARTPEDAAAAYARGDAPPSLAEAVRAFLARFGHRALSEGELRAAAWEDDPRPVFAALGALGASGAAAFGRRARAEVRHADEEALLAGIGAVRRVLVRWALAGARDGVRRRERTKAMAVALVRHGRHIARAAARHLVSAGRLRREDDVYFLTCEELGDALDGGGVSRAAVERRRRRHDADDSVPAPREVDLEATAASAATGEPGLRGLGVSPGVGHGVARVLEPGPMPRLERGEVLVASALDAALGPLLATASAAVAEIGGQLSHGAVVARELGVPCVVDVREATRRIHTGDRLVVDGSTGVVTVLGDPPAEHDAHGAAEQPPRAGWLRPALAEEERLHTLEDDPRARESVYFNAQDPASGIALVTSVGVRPRARGELLAAIALPDGRVLFGLDFARPEARADVLSVAGATVSWSPIRLVIRGRLAPHESRGFPPLPAPLLLTPRTVAVDLDLAFVPTTPAVDLCAGLAPDALDALRLLGRHHVEQSGRWVGTLEVDGRRSAFDGTGSRDHTWGLRDWDAADHWRLFTVRLGDSLAVHALAVSVRGRMVEGGFVWRDGRIERVTRVRYLTERAAGAVRSLELEVTSAVGAAVRLRGQVRRTVSVPVQLARRPTAHLVGRPYRLVLHENYTSYEGEGLSGYGMAEITERPRPT